MFNQKDFNLHFLKKLEPFFLENGFRLKITIKEFVKKEQHVELACVLWPTLWSYGYSVEPILNIKLLEAEKIYKGFLKQNPLMSKFPMVVGGKLGDLILNEGENLAQRKSIEILIEQESDIDKAEQQIKDLFNKNIKPLFNLYSDIFYVEKVLNTLSDNTPKICNNPHLQLRLGLILAKLTKRENYEDLERGYLIVNTNNSFNKKLQDEFLNFIKYLKKI